MKTIKEPQKNITLLWRKPKPTQSVYRPMKFILKAQVEEGLLLYNVVTSEMVLLDSAEEEFFAGSAAEYNPAMDDLIARHFLVPTDFDENKSVQQLRALIKKLNPAKRLNGFTILPTTECNARCYYCFESDHPRCTMTNQIVDGTVAYIADQCKGDPVEITWFGGEPLMGAKQINRICKGLQDRGITYHSSIVTNAYLFNEGLIQTAKDDWHLTTAQITLDGTEKVYNEVKAYVHPGENPYERVMRNIKLLLDKKIAVSIRLNVTKTNADDLSNLVNELAARFGGDNGLSAYSHAVYEDVGFNPISYDWDTREWVDVQTRDLDAKLREKNLLGSLARLPGLHTVHCMADSDYSRMIYPDGTIGKCENKSSLEGVGDIYHDILDEAMAAKYKETVQFPPCDNCPLFPDCLNLIVCPETGKCNKVKVEWKLDRYTTSMRKQYQKSLSKVPVENAKEIEQTECRS